MNVIRFINYINDRLNDLDDAINDEFMMRECRKLTEKMLEAGMNINTVCSIIKEYQTKYLYIKSKDTDLAKKFTMEMWWNCRGKN